jgi:universal stress protein E
MKRLLVATDLSARSARALERAIELARELVLELRVVYAIDDGLPEPLRGSLERGVEAVLREAASDAQKKGVSANWSIMPGRPHAAVLEAARKFACDLVVLGVHRDDAVRDLFVGTTVERVIRYGGRPVLVVRDPVRGPYQRVLAAVDFSPSSELAVRFALQTAPVADFALVHAFETPFPGFLPRQDFEPDNRRERETKLRELAARAARGHSEVRIAPLILEGEAEEVLRGTVAKRKPDLLALGTHGRTGVAHAILGSMTERFLSQAPCDVLAVPVRS